jgi:hypothetical protein
MAGNGAGIVYRGDRDRAMPGLSGPTFSRWIVAIETRVRATLAPRAVI